MTCVKICITGPESSGKSTLTNALSEYFQFPFVEEKARPYLGDLHRKHKLEDLTEIAKLQLKAEKLEAAKNEVFFCDTDLLTLKIWAQDKYGVELPFVEEYYIPSKADLYLLCSPDLPWQPDPLRQDKNRRHQILDMYKNVLGEMRANYKTINGEGSVRKDLAISEIENFLNVKKRSGFYAKKQK